MYQHSRQRASKASALLERASSQLRGERPASAAPVQNDEVTTYLQGLSRANTVQPDWEKFGDASDLSVEDNRPLSIEPTAAAVTSRFLKKTPTVTPADVTTKKQVATTSTKSKSLLTQVSNIADKYRASVVKQLESEDDDDLSIDEDLLEELRREKQILSNPAGQKLPSDTVRKQKPIATKTSQSSAKSAQGDKSSEKSVKDAKSRVIKEVSCEEDEEQFVKRPSSAPKVASSKPTAWKAKSRQNSADDDESIADHVYTVSANSISNLMIADGLPQVSTHSEIPSRLSPLPLNELLSQRSYDNSTDNDDDDDGDDSFQFNIQDIQSLEAASEISERLHTESRVESKQKKTAMKSRSVSSLHSIASGTVSPQPISTARHSRATSAIYTEDFDSVSENRHKASQCGSSSSGTSTQGSSSSGQSTESSSRSSSAESSEKSTSSLQDKSMSSYTNSSVFDTSQDKRTSDANEASHNRQKAHRTSDVEQQHVSKNSRRHQVCTRHTQTGIDLDGALVYQWDSQTSGAVLGTAYGVGFANPTPIATHVVGADQLEALTAYSPSMLALNDMLKQQLCLTKNFMQSQARMFNYLLKTTAASQYQYTTMESTKQFIKKHQRPKLTFEEALKKVKMEMQLE